MQDYLEHVDGYMESWSEEDQRAYDERREEFPRFHGCIVGQVALLIYEDFLNMACLWYLVYTPLPY